MKEKTKLDFLKKKEENVTYIGPSFFQIVQSNTTFENGYPPRFQKLIEEHKFLSGLIVPVSKLGEAARQIKTEGSTLNLLYKEAQRIGGE